MLRKDIILVKLSKSGRKSLKLSVLVTQIDALAGGVESSRRDVTT